MSKLIIVNKYPETSFIDSGYVQNIAQYLSGLTFEQCITALLAHELTHHGQKITNKKLCEIDANSWGCKVIKKIYGIDLEWIDERNWILPFPPRPLHNSN